MSPTRVYIVQTFFSLVPCLLYIVCAVILGTNPVIVGPHAEYGYGAFHIIPLVCLCLAIPATAQQSFASALAARGLVGWRNYSSIPERVE